MNGKKDDSEIGQKLRLQEFPPLPHFSVSLKLPPSCLSVVEFNVGIVWLSQSSLPCGYIWRVIYHTDGHLVQAKTMSTLKVLLS